MNVLKTISTTALAAAALSAGVATANAAAPAATAAQVRQYEGTITKVDRDNRTFRIRDTERGTITVRVTSRTRYERVSGFSGLRVGMKNIETTVRRANGAWVANQVERSGGGGSHGGDDRGADDHGGHGADDRGGDDHGGRGRGSDD